jgi:hypothetical protein
MDNRWTNSIRPSNRHLFRLRTLFIRLTFNKMKYRVLSPDGFDTHFNVITGNTKFYNSIKEVKAELKRFANNYKLQGYYSQICYNGYKREIPVVSIPDYCEVITV